MLNSVTIMGRIVADPELKTTTSGYSYTTFSIACERDVAGKDGNRTADFINVTAWNKTAEIACKWFNKGALVALKGRMQNRVYKDKAGKNHYTTELLAENVYFCDTAKKSYEPKKSDDFTELSDSDDFLPF